MALASTVFTQDNAVQMAKRSWLPTSARFNRPQLANGESLSATVPAVQQNSLELVRVLKRLDQLDKAMNKRHLDPKQWDMLSRAYDRIFHAWMVLSGTPGSGQRKPPPTSRARQAQSNPVVEVLAQVTPEPSPSPSQAQPNPEQPGTGTVQKGPEPAPA